MIDSRMSTDYMESRRDFELDRNPSKKKEVKKDPGFKSAISKWIKEPCAEKEYRIKIMKAEQRAVK